MSAFVYVGSSPSARCRWFVYSADAFKRVGLEACSSRRPDVEKKARGACVRRLLLLSLSLFMQLLYYILAQNYNTNKD